MMENKEVVQRFNIEDVFGSLKDYREERIDRVLSQLLRSKKINQMTNIKPKEMVFYFQLEAMSEIMKFFDSNSIKNENGEIKVPPTDLPKDMKTFMLGLSRSRDGWFVDNMFKYLKKEEVEVVRDKESEPRLK